MTQPSAGVPPRLPVKRPAAPRAVNTATLVLMVSPLVWLVMYFGGASTARAAPGSPLSTMVLLNFVQIVLILFAWAGRDTRAGIISLLVLLSVYFVGLPLWVVMETDSAESLDAELLALAPIGLVALAAVGVWMLYMPEAKAYFAQSQAFRKAARQAVKRR